MKLMPDSANPFCNSLLRPYSSNRPWRRIMEEAKEIHKIEE